MGTKIIISNLPTDVAEGDVTVRLSYALRLRFLNTDSSVSFKELFTSTVGAVRECQVSYGRDGRSKGSATVTFVRSGDATKAYNQYNNRLIDGS